MAKKKTAPNPFYILLVIVGVAFFVSACVYGVMAYRGVSYEGGAGVTSSPLLAYMDRNGMIVLGIEVLLLGILTVGAIATDEYWQRRTKREND